MEDGERGWGSKMGDRRERSDPERGRREGQERQKGGGEGRVDIEQVGQGSLFVAMEFHSAKFLEELPAEVTKGKSVPVPQSSETGGVRMGKI